MGKLTVEDLEDIRDLILKDLGRIGVSEKRENRLMDLLFKVDSLHTDRSVERKMRKMKKELYDE